MELSRKRGSSRAALDSRQGAKRIRKGGVLDDSFTTDQRSMIAQTASACNISPEKLAAAITDIQNPFLDEPPVPRKYKPRPNRRTKMPQEFERAEKQQQRGPPSKHGSPKGPVNQLNSQKPKPWQSDMNEEKISPGSDNSPTVECLGMKFVPSALADCFASLIPHEQNSNFGEIHVTMNQSSLVPYNDARYDSGKNFNVSSSSMGGYTESLLLHNSFNGILQPQEPFACDPFPFDPYTDFPLVEYMTIQATQPMSNFPEMAYLPFESELQNYANVYPSSDNEPYYSEGFHLSENEKPSFLSPEDEIHRTSPASAEPQGSRSPSRPKQPRSTVDRVQTAQTRQLAACIRCKVQRIRCVPDPNDPKGVCITCKKVSKTKFSKIMCHRYRLTDARLFKQGYLPGRVWTTRFQTMELNDIDNWDSSELKTLFITYDYSPRPLVLQVRKFKPQEGDILDRSWKHRGVNKSVQIPPYAIASFKAAEKTYEDYINQDGEYFFHTTIDKSNKLLRETMSAAIKASNCAMTEPERILLKKVLRLWVAGRFICRSERICGSETLGLPHNLIDETNPALHGKIPIPPVMGAQIDLIVISRILAPLRANILEKLQKMIMENKPRNWFCIYLCIFVLLHNCALMTQQDTAYAKKHGLKTRFAMIDLVDELHYGANILLGYFHYCTKGFHPFSLDWNAEQTLLMAELNAEQVEFVKKTAAHVKANESRFSELFDKDRYDDDLYFVAQMYEQDWKPRQTNLNAPAEV